MELEKQLIIKPIIEPIKKPITYGSLEYEKTT
jgi:hypothetical protein